MVNSFYQVDRWEGILVTGDGHFHLEGKLFNEEAENMIFKLQSNAENYTYKWNKRATYYCEKGCEINVA